MSIVLVRLARTYIQILQVVKFVFITIKLVNMQNYKIAPDGGAVVRVCW